MDTALTMGVGVFISGAIHWLKQHVPFVSRYPKVVAGAVAAVLPFALAATGTWQQYVVSALTSLAAIVGGYEVVVKPIAKTAPKRPGPTP